MHESFQDSFVFRILRLSIGHACSLKILKKQIIIAYLKRVDYLNLKVFIFCRHTACF